MMDDYNKQNKKIHLAILGTCCLRDIVSFCDKREKFEVDRFVQDVNPIAITEKSPLKKPLYDFLYSTKIDDVIKNNNFTHFRRRNFVLDLSKLVIEYISETKAEWLFLDMACLRISLTSIEGNYISNAPYYSDVIKLLKDNGFINSSGEEIAAETISDQELYEKIDSLIETILRNYKQERIILFEISPARYCANSDGSISLYPIERRYEPVYKGFKYIKSKMPKAHVVECPFNILGDQNHKWGRFPLHYVKEYYDYAYAAVDKITGGGYSLLNDERNELSILKSECERIIYDKYNSYFVKTVSGYSLFKKSYENYVLAYYERSKWIYDGLSKIDFSVSEDLICEYLRQEIDLERYILALNFVKAEYLIVFAVKDTPGNTITENEINYIRALGFSKFSKIFRMMYAGICYKNDVYCDISGEKSLLPVTYNSKIDAVNVKVSSMAWSNGNKAEILINGINYSVNMRGINIVVYDIKKDSVVDSVAFDYVMPSRTVKHMSFEYDKINNGINNIYLRQNNKILELQLDLANLNTENEKIKEYNQELTKKSDEKQNEIKKLTNRYNNLNIEINELKDDYAVLNKSYIDIEESLSRSQQQLQQSLQETEVLKSQKEVVESELNKLTEKYNVAEQEKAAIKDKLSQTQKELEEATINLKNLATRLSDMEKSLSFRTGRTITYIPRKIRDLFKKK